MQLSHKAIEISKKYKKEYHVRVKLEQFKIQDKFILSTENVTYTHFCTTLKRHLNQNSIVKIRRKNQKKFVVDFYFTESFNRAFFSEIAKIYVNKYLSDYIRKYEVNLRDEYSYIFDKNKSKNTNKKLANQEIHNTKLESIESRFSFNKSLGKFSAIEDKYNKVLTLLFEERTLDGLNIRVKSRSQTKFNNIFISLESTTSNTLKEEIDNYFDFKKLEEELSQVILEPDYDFEVDFSELDVTDEELKAYQAVEDKLNQLREKKIAEFRAKFSEN